VELASRLLVSSLIPPRFPATLVAENNPDKEPLLCRSNSLAHEKSAGEITPLFSSFGSQYIN